MFYRYCLLGALFSSLSSLLSKAAFHSSLDPSSFPYTPAVHWIDRFCSSSPACALPLYYLLRLLLPILFIYLNLVGLNYFLLASHIRGSAIAAITKDSFNILATGAVGSLVLGEQLGIKWIVGMTMIALGSAIIHRSTQAGKAD
jgi:drug/metabolite transporter (DMT)-like permease